MANIDFEEIKQKIEAQAQKAAMAATAHRIKFRCFMEIRVFNQWGGRYFSRKMSPKAMRSAMAMMPKTIPMPSAPSLNVLTASRSISSFSTG